MPNTDIIPAQPGWFIVSEGHEDERVIAWAIHANRRPSPIGVYTGLRFHADVAFDLDVWGHDAERPA